MPNTTVRAAATGLPNARLRKRIEDAIQRMIDALDAFTPDSDLEPDVDLEDGYDAEAVNEDGGNVIDEPHDQEADEPYIGSVAVHEDDNQEGWSQGNFSDQEFGIDLPAVRRNRLLAPACGKPFSAAEMTIGDIPLSGPPVHPQALAYRVNGACLDPIMKHGDVVIFEPVLPKPGELAVVWIDDDGPIVKYVLTDLAHGFRVPRALRRTRPISATRSLSVMKNLRRQAKRSVARGAKPGQRRLPLSRLRPT